MNVSYQFAGTSKADKNKTITVTKTGINYRDCREKAKADLSKITGEKRVGSVPTAQAA